MKKFPIIYCPWLHVSGIALFPFILVKYKSLNRDNSLVRHELIHIAQQIELLIIPFYIFYLLNYLINLLYYLNHDKAYRNIVFEREAYSNENKENYLSSRKIWSFMKHF
jgi:hypothetical protein